MIGAPILGRLSDRWGRKPLLLVSQLGTLAGFILLAVAHSLPLLFFSRMLDGLTGGNLSIAQAAIADVTTEKDRAKAYGLINHWPPLLGALVFTALGGAAVSPALQSLYTRSVLADERGGVLGLAASAESLARIGAPIWGG